MRNYRYWRIGAALLCFAALNSAFLDFSGWAVRTLGWTVRLQFIPACLSLNALALVFFLLLTFIGGRHYCSWICPLGIYQDGVAWLTRNLRRRPYIPSPAWQRTRIITLIVFAALGVFGFMNVCGWLDPYSIYGRFAALLFAPLYRFGNNALASLATANDSFTFAAVQQLPWSWTTLVLTLLSWVAVTVLAWKSGRLYCNAICPVGTALGLISTKSVFQVQLDTEKCRSCRACEKECKSQCIDIANKSVDFSRCVVCGRCWQTCKFEGIYYGKRK